MRSEVRGAAPDRSPWGLELGERPPRKQERGKRNFALIVHQPVWVDISKLEKTGESECEWAPR
jgi:hypothetical protein